MPLDEVKAAEHKCIGDLNKKLKRPANASNA
jgi:hypothetical protein